jgi:RNA polymerase sigma factor (sigma-70 family)
MEEHEALAEQFEANRAHLQGVAYRMLGSSSEADDAVQEAWLRLNRSDTSGVENLRGWLTTVVARVCLDMLRSRKSRAELPIDERVPEAVATSQEADPEHEALVADSVGLALLVVLQTLSPAERVAFVLHDMFDMPFDEIAPIAGRSSTAARQLASRARRRVRGAEVPDTDRSRQREIVNAFLAAARGGDFGKLVAVLDPSVLLRADSAAVLASASRQAAGAPKLAPVVYGAAAVADTFAGGRAAAAQPALVNGATGLVWAPGGQPRAVFGFTIARGKIVEIELIADPERIGQLDVVVLSE